MVNGSTRIRILDTALDLFGTRGVGTVSLDDIADAVGVRKQTILYWFKSRSGLIDAVLDHAADELLVVVEAEFGHEGMNHSIESMPLFARCSGRSCVGQHFSA